MKAILSKVIQVHKQGAPAMCMAARGYVSSAPSTLQHTPLYELHKARGAKFGPFAGYSMPLQYADGGRAATAFLDWLVPTSIAPLKDGQSTLSVLLNDNGGIIDDLMITRLSQDRFYLVTNASRKEQDILWLRQRLSQFNADQNTDVLLSVVDDRALVAVQGPKAVAAIQNHVKADLSHLYFGQSTLTTTVEGTPIHIARSGYTGEDGVEISLPEDSATGFVTSLLESEPTVHLAGLAARDSLRIEAGLCLYGQEMDDTTTPVEAALSWLVSKNKREPNAFIGAAKVIEQLKDPKLATRRRVGLVVQEAPARHGAEIYDAEGSQLLGKVTSGIPSPTLKQNIAMAYVSTGFHKKDTELQVKIRNKMRPAKVTKMPFVPAKYYRPS